MSGLARPREWDATALVEARALVEGELRFRAYKEGVVGAPIGTDAVARAVETLDALVERPYEALLVHRGATTWAVAARAISGELVRLPGVEARSLELVTAPDGERTVRLDDEDAPFAVAPSVAAALDELERRGRTRFQAHVVAADRVEDDLWEVRVDPL